jgi:uncharacterized membrane protein
MNPDQQPFVGPGHFGRGGGPMYFGDHHDGGASWHWIVPLLFLLALGAMIVWMVLQSRRTPRAAVPGGTAAVDPALAELRLRYARGEVSREEFVATEADLRGLATPPPAPPAPEPPAAPPAAA